MAKKDIEGKAWRMRYPGAASRCNQLAAIRHLHGMGPSAKEKPCPKRGDDQGWNPSSTPRCQNATVWARKIIAVLRKPVTYRNTSSTKGTRETLATLAAGFFGKETKQQGTLACKIVLLQRPSDVTADHFVGDQEINMVQVSEDVAMTEFCSHSSEGLGYWGAGFAPASPQRSNPLGPPAAWQRPTEPSRD